VSLTGQREEESVGTIVLLMPIRMIDVPNGLRTCYRLYVFGFCLFCCSLCVRVFFSSVSVPVPQHG